MNCMAESLHSPESLESRPQEDQPETSADSIADAILTGRFQISEDDPRKSGFIEQMASDVEDATKFLCGNGVKIESLSDYQKDEVEQLSEELFMINSMEWKLTKEGEHYKAKRSDGSEVFVPASYFPDGEKELDLKNVHVNTKDGYTIHDALKRIIGSEAFLRKEYGKPEQEG